MDVSIDDSICFFCHFLWDMQKPIIIKSVEGDLFWPLIEKHSERIFDETGLVFRLNQHLQDSEKAKLKELNKEKSGGLTYFFVAEVDGEIAGWSWGRQDGPRTVYMVNSAVLEDFRRQGVYQSLLDHVVAFLVEKGVEKITSRHQCVNNPVIIPKLKKGFVIEGLEVTEIFGTLVNLAFYPNKFHKDLMDYRSGEKKPAPQIKKALNI